MCRIIQKNLSYIEEATKKWEATCNDIVLQAHVEAQHSAKINFFIKFRYMMYYVYNLVYMLTQ